MTWLFNISLPTNFLTSTELYEDLKMHVLGHTSSWRRRATRLSATTAMRLKRISLLAYRWMRSWMVGCTLSSQSSCQHPQPLLGTACAGLWAGHWG